MSSRTFPRHPPMTMACSNRIHRCGERAGRSPARCRVHPAAPHKWPCPTGPGGVNPAQSGRRPTKTSWYDGYAYDEDLAAVRGDKSPAPSPSGRYMAFVNDTSGIAKIYIAKSDGSPRRQLTYGYQPDWQRLS